MLTPPVMSSLIDYQVQEQKESKETNNFSQLNFEVITLIVIVIIFE